MSTLKRFAKAPKNAFDAHRTVRDDENLDRIFAWREQRKVTRRRHDLVEVGPAHAAFGRAFRLSQDEAGNDADLEGRTAHALEINRAAALVGRDLERGQDFREDLFSPGVFVSQTAPGEDVKTVSYHGE